MQGIVLWETTAGTHSISYASHKNFVSKVQWRIVKGLTVYMKLILTTVSQYENLPLAKT